MVAPAIIGAGIIGGSSLLSSGKAKKGGGGGGGNDAAALQASIARNMLSSTRPLRGSLFGGGAGLTPVEQSRLDELEGIMSLRGMPAFHDPNDLAQLMNLRKKASDVGTGQIPDFLNTGELPLSLDMPFTATRENLEDQFGVAREQVLRGVPARGGQLNSILADLESGRARAVGELPLRELPIRQNLFSQAMQIASGSPVQAAGIAGSAGALEESIAARGAASQQASSQALGSSAALAAKFALKNRGGGGVNTGPLESGTSEILLG